MARLHLACMQETGFPNFQSIQSCIRSYGRETYVQP